MSVILAIESNQQQIAQLTAIVRGLGAELVSAKTAERALAALGAYLSHYRWYHSSPGIRVA